MLNKVNLTAAEEKLAALIWKKAPMSSPDLVFIAKDEMGWKKSTTYTVLKKLCDKGIFKNDKSMVSTVLTQDELIRHQSRHYIEDTFGGSLPKFIVSFFGGHKISSEQAEELKRLIDEHDGGGDNG